MIVAVVVAVVATVVVLAGGSDPVDWVGKDPKVQWDFVVRQWDRNRRELDCARKNQGRNPEECPGSSSR